MAVAPLSKPIVIDSVSPFVKSLPSLASLAQTLIGRPSSAIDRSTMCMPVAESGPTGFAESDNRQLSLGNFRNLSWLKLPSSSSGLPNSPDSSRSRISMTAGSKTAFVSDAQLHPRPSHGRDGGLRLGRRRAQRVLGKNVTSRPPRSHDLPPMMALWCPTDAALPLSILHPISAPQPP